MLKLYLTMHIEYNVQCAVNEGVACEDLIFGGHDDGTVCKEYYKHCLIFTVNMST
jgi:hypothetical protein